MISTIDNCHNGIELTVAKGNSQAVRQGVYLFNETDTETGLPTFYQNGGKSAMWFHSGRWRIGYGNSNLGTEGAGIRSTKAEPCPELIGTDWQYFINNEGDGKWRDSENEISIAPHSG